jgi:hypothetical protein
LIESNIKSSSIIGISCKSWTDCHQSQFCVNNKCECEPNYKYDNLSNICKYKWCRFYWDCRKYFFGKFEREKHYAINQKTNFCNTRVVLSRKIDYDCTNSGDYNQICIDSDCERKPNFQMTWLVRTLLALLSTYPVNHS